MTRKRKIEQALHPHTATLHRATVVDISRDRRRLKQSKRPLVPLDDSSSATMLPPLPTPGFSATDSDLDVLQPVVDRWEEASPVTITNQIHGLTVITTEKPKRYDSSVSANTARRPIWSSCSIRMPL